MTLSGPSAKTLNRYLINEAIDFDPATYHLLNRATGAQVTLYAPASRCLHLLIRKQGTVIPQRELMESGWSKYGLSVSPNAYYQNVAYIRKAFNELLPGQEIITTIKRAGLVIENDINIVPLKISCEQKNIKPLVLPGVTKKLEEEQNEFLPKSIGKRYLWAAGFLILISINLLGGSVIFFQQKTNENKTFFKNYFLYKKTSTGCNVYLNKDSTRTLDSTHLVSNENFDCKGFEKVYITRWATWPRESAMYCSADWLHLVDLACITDYYGKEHQ